MQYLIKWFRSLFRAVPSLSLKFQPNGFVQQGPQGKDYIQGVNSPLKPQPINPSGDWAGFVPNGERQSDAKGFDTNDCTGFGYTNAVETRINFLIRNKLLSVSAMKFLTDNGYLDPNGEPNFSDRALGSMAGTTQAGNSMGKVAETARTKGLVPESKWTWDRTLPMTAEQYYEPVPQELLDLALEFLSYFELPYEWCTGTADDFRHAPLYVGLCTCDGWNTPPVQACNQGNATNHAVCQVNASPEIYDSYPPYLKQLAGGYPIPYKMKVLVAPKGQTMLGFKKTGDATVYVPVGSVLVPVTDWNAFLTLGGSTASVVELAPDQFAKFSLGTGALFKSA
jgi:hypothetical protein